MPLLTSEPGLLRGPGLTPPPGRKRAIIVPLLILLLLGVAVLQGVRGLQGPSAQEELLSHELGGGRGPTCLRLVIGMDVSGSMGDFQAARDAALAQLQVWAGRPRTLRPDDEIAVADFAFEAATRFAPTPAASSPRLPGVPVDDGTDTLLRPMLEQVRGFGSTSCDVVLLLISDAQLTDLPADAARGVALLRQYGIHDLRLLVPGAAIDVPGAWQNAFPSAPPIRFDGLDEDETALTIGQTIADLTEQRLVPVAVRPT